MNLKEQSLFVTVLVSLFISEVSYSMKVALPEQFEFQSEDNTYKFVYKPGEAPFISHPNGKWIWKGVKPTYPSQVIVAPAANLVYMLGSYGDAGHGLGLVETHDIKTGKTLRKYDLKNEITNLDMMSKVYGEQTNFPWISGTKLVSDGTQIEIKVCGKVTAKIDSKSDVMVAIREFSWFKKIGCEEVTLQEYEDLSGKKLKRKLNIKDPKYARSLQVSIDQLPTEGEKTKDMSQDTSYLALEFKCGGETEVVEFFGGRVKTPAHNFYARTRILENEIWEEIQSLFARPELSKEVPYYVGQILDFGDFTLSYQDQEDRTPVGTTASSYVATFKLKSKKNSSIQDVEVRSGQLAPRPVDFEVNEKKYTLYTFSYRDQRMRPRHLVVAPK